MMRVGIATDHGGFDLDLKEELLPSSVRLSMRSSISAPMTWVRSTIILISSFPSREPSPGGR
jgi:hypothetical protein